MDAKKLREVEDIYKDLKYKLEAGEISGDYLKAELKKTMIRADDNRYWMIGNKTGGWYVYDGSAWNAADPYSQIEAAPVAEPEPKPKKSLELFLNNEEEKKTPSEPLILCKFCQTRIKKHDGFCNSCGEQQWGVRKFSTPKMPERELLIKAVRIISLIFFFGGVGLIVGIIFGATFGVFKIFGNWIFKFPQMLQDMRGQIQGGLFFGAIGGIAGFVGFALVAALFGLFYNALAYIFGGLRFKVKP